MDIQSQVAPKLTLPPNSGFAKLQHATGTNLVFTFSSNGLAPESASDLGGANSNPNHYGVNSDGVKAMLATALTAYALGKSLSFVFDDSTTNCYINRLSIQ